MTIPSIHSHALLFFAILGSPLLSVNTGSAQSTDSLMGKRTSFLMPFAGYEIGTPQAIQRAPGIVNRGEFGASGEGRSIDHTSLFGFELLFPRIVNDAFGLSLQISLAESDGWFESNPFDDTNGIIDLATGSGTTATTTFDIESSETQARVTILGTWDIPGLRIAVGPWAGYRVSSRLLQTQQILSPDSTVFAADRQRTRLISADDSIASFRWRFGGTARISHDIFLSSTFAVVPFAGLRFDAESLINQGLGLRAFSARVGLGFSVTWRPDPVERFEELLQIEEELTTPRFSFRPVGEIVIGKDVRGDTIVVGERRTFEHEFIGIPDRWPSTLLTDRSPLSENVLPGADRLAQLPLSDILRILPLLLATRLSEDPELQLTLRSGREDEEANQLRTYLVDTCGIDSARVVIQREDSSSIAPSTLHLVPSHPRLLDPLALRRTVVDLQAPDLIIHRDDREIASDDTAATWRFMIRRDDRLIGEYGRDDRTITIGRDEFIPEGGTITLSPFRGSGEDRVEIEGDTLFYRVRPVDQSRIRRWILPGKTATEGEEPTRQAFLRMIGMTLMEWPTGTLMIEAGEEGGVEFLRDLTPFLPADYRGRISIDLLPGGHPLNRPPWRDGVIAVVESNE